MRRVKLFLIVFFMPVVVFANIGTGIGTISLDRELTGIVRNVSETEAVCLYSETDPDGVEGNPENGRNSRLQAGEELAGAAEKTAANKSRGLFSKLAAWLKGSKSKPPVSTKDIRLMDEKFEKAVLGGKNKSGKLLELSSGNSTLAISIHGISDCPRIMALASDWAVAKGYTNYTFCYDDSYRSLWDNASDLARAIESVLAAGNYKEVIINAHSLGGRITLGAVDILQKRRTLSKLSVQLNLFAPPVDGFKYADLSKFAPACFGFIKGVRPGKDIGQDSAYQKMLATLKLDSNVQLRIFSGGKDKIVPPDKKFFGMVKLLKGTSVHFPKADHNEVIAQAVAVI